jgi:hypothetical protein
MLGAARDRQSGALCALGTSCAHSAQDAASGGRSSATLAADLTMKHSDFRIGLEFWCGGKLWRCTDVGTRVVTAISLAPHEVVEVTLPRRALGRAKTRRYLTKDPSWLIGPPYAVVEEVFDEYSQEGCSLKGQQKEGRPSSANKALQRPGVSRARSATGAGEILRRPRRVRRRAAAERDR